MKDLLNYSLTHFRTEKVQLGCIIPRHYSAVIAMIDISGVACEVVNPFKGYRSIGTVPVAIFKVNAVAGITAEIRPVIRVIIIWRCIGGKKPVGTVTHQFRIHSGMVRNHIACKTDSSNSGSVPEVLITLIAADIFGNIIFFKRIRRSFCLRVSLELFNLLRSVASLPDAD